MWNWVCKKKMCARWAQCQVFHILGQTLWVLKIESISVGWHSCRMTVYVEEKEKFSLIFHFWSKINAQQSNVSTGGLPFLPSDKIFHYFTYYIHVFKSWANFFSFHIKFHNQKVFFYQKFVQTYEWMSKNLPHLKQVLCHFLPPVPTSSMA